MKKLNILVVDDNASMRKLAKSGLERSFLNSFVDEATNGKEAQMKMEASEYDLVLYDWEMPDDKGDEVLQWVRQHPTKKSIPFVMVTSINDRATVLKAIADGANGYLVKPYTAEQLARKIMAAIDRFDRRQLERVPVEGTVVVHFQDTVATGRLIDMSLETNMGGLFGTFERKNLIPSILEKVIIDIELDDNLKLSGIEGFVIRIQAAEAFLDTEEVNVAIKFADLPENEHGQLTGVLNSLT